MKIDLKNVNLLILRASNQSGNPMSNLVGMVVQFGAGNFTWALRDTIDYQLERGRLGDVRRGDEVPIDISFTGKYEYIQSYGANPVNALSLTEALDGVLANGDPSPWIAEGVETEPWLECAPYCIALELHNDLRRECPNVTNIEAMLFRYFRAESHAMDTNAGTIAIAGKCNIVDPFVKRVLTASMPYTVDELPTPLDGWPDDPRG